MKLKFPKRTKYAQILEAQVRANRSAIDTGIEIELDIGERTGFVEKTAHIIIKKDEDAFEADWKWATNTFPGPLKALAHALGIVGLVGTFATKYLDGRITIRKVEQGIREHSP